MSALKIIKMTPELTQAAAELEQICFSTPWSREGFLSALESDDNIFLAALDLKSGKLIGYIGLYTAADEGEITNVAVSPDERRKGIGYALLRVLFARARDKGICRIYLEVRAGNEPAIHLYESSGFVPCGIRKNFYRFPTEDATVMVRDLTNPAEEELC